MRVELNRIRVDNQYNLQRQPIKILIGGATLACALVAIWKISQHAINGFINDVECTNPNYYHYTKWWTAASDYCLGEEQINKNNPSYEDFVSARLHFLKAAKQGLSAAHRKLCDPNLYPIMPSQNEIDELMSTVFTENCQCKLPWTYASL